MDELAHGELGLCVDPGGPYGHVTQIVDNLPVLLKRLWVNLQLGDLLVSQGHGGALPLALGLEFVDLQLRVFVRDQADCDGADNPLDGGIQFLDALSGGRPVLSCAMGQALELSDVLIDELLDDAWPAQFLLETADNGFFDPVEPNPGDVAAGPAFPAPAAADHLVAIAVSVEGHPCATVTTPQEARQEVPCPVPVLTFLPCPPAGILPRLGLLPEIGIDNGQLRNLMGLPLTLRIDSADALAGVGIPDHADPVPDEKTFVEGVLDDAIAAPGIAVDGGGVPDGAAGRGDAIFVQLIGDVAG